LICAGALFRRSLPDAFSPHQDLISANGWPRSGAHPAACNKDWRRRNIVPATQGAVRLAPFQLSDTTILEFKVSKVTEVAQGQLTLAATATLTQVISPEGTAVRGGLIDLFLMAGSALPGRSVRRPIDSIRT
jgi:transcription-repair coupling factor (superfamily II helicase)